ncbi:hypothetical protein P154DRAFT_573963 [Amniculicola lignicola CBS 123094]|uniref:NAD(P)-binding protein n=1 Tax=Amniculicola lignicola CBS 123094 TaxID=1392246 RepID=A0A6A5WNQ7_9PLEO|nr:hypothetical protein P154DRAFT_573963 [Amniculicola lignicola CBS 123094]
MTKLTEVAYVTGGASGIGRAFAETLIPKGYHVFIANVNITLSQSVCSTLNTSSPAKLAHCAHVDLSNWKPQKTAFQQTVDVFGRIDFVVPVVRISKNPILPEVSEGVVEPNLTVLDVDLKGVFAIVAFIRTYGALAPSSSSITLNAVCPNTIRTAIGNPACYAAPEGLNLIVPMKNVMAAFEHMLEISESVMVWECAPGTEEKFMMREGLEHWN